MREIKFRGKRLDNNEMLCAGWCGCTSPNNLLNFLKNKGENYDK